MRVMLAGNGGPAWIRWRGRQTYVAIRKVVTMSRPGECCPRREGITRRWQSPSFPPGFSHFVQRNSFSRHTEQVRNYYAWRLM